MSDKARVYDPTNDPADKQRGLYNKYHVTMPGGIALPPEARFFVLRYDRLVEDKAAREALFYYAQQVKESHPQLSADLFDYLTPF